MRGISIYSLLKDDDDNVLIAERLGLGKHFLKHAGAQVPVEIGEDDSVTVFLSDFRGVPNDLFLAGFGDDDEEEVLRQGVLREVRLKTAPGDTTVALLGVNEGADTRLAITPLHKAPTLGERARR